MLITIKFLIEKDFKCEDDELSLELLSVIAMQLLQQPRSTKLASEAFKALSYLILDLHQKNVTASITDSMLSYDATWRNDKWSLLGVEIPTRQI